MEPSRESAAAALPDRDLLLSAYPALVAMIRHRLAGALEAEAEDLAQEAVLAAWAALSGSNPGHVRDPVQYVLGIAPKKCSDALRQDRRRRHVPLDGALDEAQRCRLAGAAAEQRLLRDELRRRLARAARRLNRLEREMLRLRYLDQLSNHEACQKLRIPPDEGSRIKYRALDKLRLFLRAGRRRGQWR